MLITTEQLAEHLGDPKWVIVDTRSDLVDPEHGPMVYAQGHIPGAYYLGTDDDLSGPKTGKNGRHPLPDIADFAEKINKLGVGPDTHVVAYDDIAGGFAVRLWWMLRWLGHDKAYLLDGGLPLWVKEGKPVNKQVPPARPGAFVPKPHLGGTVDVHYVDRHREDPQVKLIDARSAERFKGIKEPIDPVAGHVPGAVNRFWKDNVIADGRFKTPAQLRAEFKELLEGRDAEQVVHMCGSGVTACHNLFAMELAGLAGGRIYAGSWSEWCAEPSRAVAKE